MGLDSICKIFLFIYFFKVVAIVLVNICIFWVFIVVVVGGPSETDSDKWESSRWNIGNKNCHPMGQRAINRFTKTGFAKMWLEFYSTLYYHCLVQL